MREKDCQLTWLLAPKQEVDSFAADGEELTFWQLQRRVQAVGEALIGWYEIPLKVRDATDGTCQHITCVWHPFVRVMSA